MSPATTFRRLAFAELERIAPLWEELRRLHEAESVDFKDRFRRQTFAQRMRPFAGRADDTLHLDAAFLAEDPETSIAYLLSSMNGDCGELDSLFVRETHRGQGLGSALIERALAWLEEKGAARIEIGVAVGNERVLPFYRRFGFYPRQIVLERKP